MGGYTFPINKNTDDAQQSSPGYVLTCLRFSNRDTYNYEGLTSDPTDTRQPLVIINDAIQITVNNTKSGYHSNMTAVLKGGDINYATALAPGDHIMVNLLNWEKDVWRVANKARNLEQINKVGDGFKGNFKIQTVRKNFKVNQTNGIKSVIYTIHASGFTEFNNVIHFNPAIKSAFAESGTKLYQIAIGEFFQNLLLTTNTCQDLTKSLFKILIGKSQKDNEVGVENYGNSHFQVPRSLGPLLGDSNIKFASDMFNFVVGLWPASTTSSRTLKDGMNPSFTSGGKDAENFYDTGTPISGDKQISMEDWNNNQTWSIIQNNINSTMNEIFTTYRVNKEGNVMPTVVVRQKPFTTEHFTAPDGYETTKFFDLPRWKISPDLLLSLDLGKDEATRYNFVQVFSSAIASVPQLYNLQISLGNFEFDETDIQKHGLKPYIKTANFNFPQQKGAEANSGGWELHAVAWSKIVSDWVLNGHNKTSGKLSFIGIEKPISVGDNIEFDNTVLHIESVSHTFSMIGAKKSFRTNLTVSSGVDLASDSSRPVYSEMEHTDAWTRLKADQKDKDANYLPGIGDTQFSLGRDRTDGEELKNTRQESFTLDPVEREVKSNPTTIYTSTDDDGTEV